MSAPLAFFCGAPVAQTGCATAEIPYRINPAAQTRATAFALWRNRIGARRWIYPTARELRAPWRIVHVQKDDAHV